MIELLEEQGAGHIKVFGGGGGVIVQDEIDDLHNSGVSRIFSVDDGSEMGLQGMINYMIHECDYDPVTKTEIDIEKVLDKEPKAIARAITALENGNGELISFSDKQLLKKDGKPLKAKSENDSGTWNHRNRWCRKEFIDRRDRITLSNRV